MDQLESDIQQYETQLSQVQLAIASSPDGPEKTNLVSLEADMKELIKLTKENLQQCTLPKESDPLDDEYNLFKSELAEIDPDLKEVNQGSTSQIHDEALSASIKELNDDIKELEGMKCQAPYKYAWTNDVSYHNALVFQIVRSGVITKSDDIKVKVVFTNPTHKEMLPCPYYLEGKCKFNDEKCRFSHGEVVNVNSLKEFRDPDFSSLISGSKVLAKQDDNLWHRAVILSIDGVNCRIKLENSSKEEEMHLQNVFPLSDSEIVKSNYDDEDDDSEDDDDDEDDDSEVVLPDNEKEELVKRILQSPPTSSLGDWEKFTKGIGSKIMAKMGYVHGSGLGSNCDGRVEPVNVVVFPAGKSLDHCMQLRENSGNDSDLFKAEKKMKRLQKKHEEALNRAYEREKQRTDFFTFLNNKLGQSSKTETTQSNSGLQLKNGTTRELNIASLKLSEEVRKTEKEIKSLNESLGRSSSKSPAFSVLKGKLNEQEEKLFQLKASEKRIFNEQEQRRDRKKLSVF